MKLDGEQLAAAIELATRPGTRFTVRELIGRLLDFDMDSLVCVQTHAGDESAIVALMDDDEIDKRRGRFADGIDTVCIVPRLS
jgi:arginine repressor